MVCVGITLAMTGDLAQAARAGAEAMGIQPFTRRRTGQFAVPFGITFLLAAGYFLAR